MRTSPTTDCGTRLLGNPTGHPSAPRRILAVQLGGLREIVCFTPVLTALRRRFPAATIGALVRPPAEEILAGSRDLDERIALSTPGPRWNPAEGVRLGRRLALSPYDWVIAVDPSPAVGLALRLARIGWRTGVSTKGRGLLAPGCFHQVLRQDRRRGARHEVDYNLDLLRALGIEPDHDGPAIWESPDAAGLAARELRIAGIGPETPYAVLAPGYAEAGTPWPAEYFARVGDELAEQHRFRTVVVGGSGESPLCEQIAAAMGHPARSLAGRVNLGELLAVMRASQVAVGLPSGMLHVAAAAGTPVVTLYGPWERAADRARFRPYEPVGFSVRRAAHTLQRFGVGAPDGDFGLPTPGRGHVEIFSPQQCDCRGTTACPTTSCMRAIKPGEVLAAVRHLVESGAGAFARGVRAGLPASGTWVPAAE